MENYLNEIPNKISDASALRRFVGNLYQGWGYNAYSKKEQLRADDLIIRTQINALISELKKRWYNKEMDWRKNNIPELTRENPFPDKEAIKIAKSIHEIQVRLDNLKGIITNSPAPSTDRVFVRYFNEVDNLERLKKIDNEIIYTLIKLISNSKEMKTEEFNYDEIEDLLNSRKNMFTAIN